MVVGLMSSLHVYEKRTGNYLSHFKHYVDEGCGRKVRSRPYLLHVRQHFIRKEELAVAAVGCSLIRGYLLVYVMSYRCSTKEKK